jgi:integrase
MKQIFDTAVEDNIIAKNPVDSVKFPVPGKVERHVLSGDECIALINAIDENYVPLIHFALATGVRGGELVRMNIGDLNLLKKEVRVADSKTEAGVRPLSLDDATIAQIAKHLAATNRTGASPEQPIFTSPSGKRLNYGNFYRRIFKPGCRVAGFPDVVFHDLRRTHGTMLVSQGYDAKVVQERMGHTSLETTLKFYAQATEEGRREAAGALERYLNGGSVSRLKRAN